MYAEDEILDGIVVRPEDSTSQRKLPFVPELSPPPIGGSALTDVTSTVSYSFTGVSTGFTRNGRFRCGVSRNRRSVRWRRWETSTEMSKVKVTNVRNLFFSNTCLGPSARTVRTYSDASTKNAILHLRRAYKLGPVGDLPPPAIRQHGLRIRRHYPTCCMQSEVFKAVLLLWMTICNYSFQRSGEYELPLAGWLPSRMCMFLLFFPTSYVYSSKHRRK